MTQRLGGHLPGNDTRAEPRKVAIALGVVAVLAVLAVVTGNGVYAGGAAAFLIALLTSVVIHEAGHFLTAKRYGMKATQFFVGFGPTIFSRQRGETEYGVKALPAGGFVKIVGMTSLEELDPADEDRAFHRQPAGQRAVVLAAGSTMHFVLAIVITAIAVFAIGGPAETSPAVGAVSQCVAPDPAPGAPEPLGDACAVPGSVPAPALAAGLLPGDVITAVDGVPISASSELTGPLRAAPGTPVALTVDRDGQTTQVSLVPAAVDRYVFDDNGEITGLETAGTIGISVQQRLGTERLGPLESLDATGDLLYGYVDGVWTTFTEKLGSITQLYSDDRDPAGFIGVVGAGRISGEVATAPEWSTGYKALTFLILIAGLNLFVGVFNLLPLLPLDGGHLAVLGFEQARDKVRRRSGYTGALQRVDLTKLLPVTYVVVFVFAFATLFIMGADIVNPIRITS